MSQNIEDLRKVLHARVDKTVEEMIEADQQLTDVNQSSDEERKNRAVDSYNKALGKLGDYLGVEDWRR